MINNAFWITMVTAILACIVTTIGIYVINKFARWGKKNIVYFISFAAGVLISVSFIHIIPKSFELNKNAPIFLLMGFLSLHIFNRFLNIFVCNKQQCKDYVFGIIPALGIGLHSFIDGMIYSITFNVSIFTGVLAAIGMVLHEFPEGIVTFLLLVKSGFKKRKASLYAFLTAAITTPLGALISWPFINRLNQLILGNLLSFSAGALIYVGATHLLPEAEKEDKKYSIIALIAGIGVAVIIVLSKA